MTAIDHSKEQRDKDRIQSLQSAKQDLPLFGGYKQYTWKHLLIFQEGKCQSALGGFKISSPAGVCYDFIQQLSSKSQK